MELISNGFCQYLPGNARVDAESPFWETHLENDPQTNVMWWLYK